MNKEMVMIILVLALLIVPTAVNVINSVSIMDIPDFDNVRAILTTFVTTLGDEGGDKFDDPWHPA
jgi:hypothetical protein